MPCWLLNLLPEQLQICPMDWGIETPQSPAIISCLIRQPSYSIFPGVLVTCIIVNNKHCFSFRFKISAGFADSDSFYHLAENVQCTLGWWGSPSFIHPSLLLFYLVLSAKERVPPPGCGIGRAYEHKNVLSYERQIQSNCVRKNFKECLVSLIIIT